jgi:hypothetical protein
MLAGLIANKKPWAVGQLCALPQVSQVTRHVCVEGWSMIGKWTGTPLRTFFERIGADTTARYVGFECADGYYESMDMATALLVEAAELLLERPDRVVLGPAEDGGCYLLGMGAPHAHLFEDIAWSTDTVAEATRARARTLGLEVVELAPWYDVDDRDALLRLIEEISAPATRAAAVPYAAPVTAACLGRIGLRRAAVSLAAQ